MWPIVLREWVGESRRSLNYWLRVLGAGAAIFVFFGVLTDRRVPAGQVGAHLFPRLNAALFLAIWALAPLMTADCLSREKRAGTLGLLFLTPLRPLGIVMGKSLLHGWRAVTVLFAMLPMLAFAFAFGGVTGKDLAMAVLLNSAALSLALAAGLLASAWARDGTRALIAAECLSAFFGVLFVSAHLTLFLRAEFLYGNGSGAGGLASPLWESVFQAFWSLSWPAVISAGCEVSTGLGGSNIWGGPSWSVLWGGMTPDFLFAWLFSAALLLCVCLLVFVRAVRLAAWRISRSWQDHPPSIRRQRVWRFFFAPRFWRAFFRGRMSWHLDRNPVGWLQRRTWSVRVTGPAWCLFVILVECYLLSYDRLPSLLPGQFILGFLTLLALAFVSADSLRREWETGALELLLVTPLTEGQVVWGRLRGLWGQFLPAAAVILAAVSVCGSDLVLFPDPYSPPPFWRTVGFWCVCASIYLTMPAIGLYLSLHPRIPFLGRGLITCLWGIASPWGIILLDESHRWGMGVYFALLGGGAATYFIHHNLFYRKFLVATSN